MLHEFKRSVGFFPAFRINIFEYPRYYKLRISLYVCTFSKLVAWYIFREVKRAHSRRESKFFIAYRSFQISLTHNYNYSQGLIPRSASLQAESKSIKEAHFILLAFSQENSPIALIPNPPPPLLTWRINTESSLENCLFILIWRIYNHLHTKQRVFTKNTSISLFSLQNFACN